MTKEYASLQKLVNLMSVFFLCVLFAIGDDLFGELAKDIAVVAGVLFYGLSLRWINTDFDQIVRIR